MLCRVSTENCTLFWKVASVIFCDDSVQYDNSLLLFRAVIDCWMHSAVHSVLVDSCKIIWDVLLLCFQALHRYPPGRVCPSLRKPCYSSQFTFLRLWQYIEFFAHSDVFRKCSFSSFQRTFTCIFNFIFMLVPVQSIQKNFYCFAEPKGSLPLPRNSAIPAHP